MVYKPQLNSRHIFASNEKVHDGQIDFAGECQIVATQDIRRRHIHSISEFRLCNSGDAAVQENREY